MGRGEGRKSVFGPPPHPAAPWGRAPKQRGRHLLGDEAARGRTLAGPQSTPNPEGVEAPPHPRPGAAAGLLLQIPPGPLEVGVRGFSGKAGRGTADATGAGKERAWRSPGEGGPWFISNRKGRGA